MGSIYAFDEGIFTLEFICGSNIHEKNKVDVEEISLLGCDNV
jgi:hypothetical protein